MRWAGQPSSGRVVSTSSTGSLLSVGACSNPVWIHTVCDRHREHRYVTCSWGRVVELVVMYLTLYCIRLYPVDRVCAAHIRTRIKHVRAAHHDARRGRPVPSRRMRGSIMRARATRAETREPSALAATGWIRGQGHPAYAL